MQTQTETLAQLIREWRADIAMQTDTRNITALLCYCYNWATSPSALRTDREHQACVRLARWCMTRLRHRPGWHEMSTGALWI